MFAGEFAGQIHMCFDYELLWVNPMLTVYLLDSGDRWICWYKGKMPQETSGNHGLNIGNIRKPWFQHVLTMVSTILPIKSRKIQESLELFRRADEVVSSFFCSARDGRWGWCTQKVEMFMVRKCWESLVNSIRSYKSHMENSKSAVLQSIRSTAFRSTPWCFIWRRKWCGSGKGKMKGCTQPIMAISRSKTMELPSTWVSHIVPW